MKLNIKSILLIPFLVNTLPGYSMDRIDVWAETPSKNSYSVSSSQSLTTDQSKVLTAISYPGTKDIYKITFGNRTNSYSTADAEEALVALTEGNIIQWNLKALYETEVEAQKKWDEEKGLSDIAREDNRIILWLHNLPKIIGVNLTVIHAFIQDRITNSSSK